MQIDTIKGSDWGFDSSTYIGTAFRTARGDQGGEDDACIFISDQDGEPPALNVFIALLDEDRDSSDFNPFRQYVRPVTDLVTDISRIAGMTTAFRGDTINQLDRELVKVFGFTRII